MHGRRLVAHEGYRSGCRRRGSHFFGMDVEEMGPASRVVVSAAVISAVVLSAIFLMIVAPGMWWLVTIYGWMVFPALGTLASGLSGKQTAARNIIREPAKPVVPAERQLLEALARTGELTPTRAALETSLSVAEAEELLAELARGGFIEVHVRDGGLFYSMWDSGSESGHRRSSGDERGE